MIEPLESRLLLSTSVHNGLLVVVGTAGADRITVVQKGKTFTVREGSSNTNIGADQNIWGVQVTGLEGNDRITVSAKVPASLFGGDGNDIIRGGRGQDMLVGGAGADRIFGSGGNDMIQGGAGKDQIHGGAGNDMIDVLDNQPDKITGGRGRDQARVDDEADRGWNIEDWHMSELLVLNPYVFIDLGGLPIGGNGTVVGNPLLNNNSNLPAGSDAEVHVNAGKLVLGGDSTIYLSDFSAVTTSDFVLIDYNNSASFIGGFTTGTYRLFNSGIYETFLPGSYTYSNVETTTRGWHDGVSVPIVNSTAFPDPIAEPATTVPEASGLPDATPS